MERYDAMRGRSLVPLVMAVAVLAGCTTVISRSPAPESALNSLAPYGIVSEEGLPLRLWGDTIDVADPEHIEDKYKARVQGRFADAIARGETIQRTAIAFSGGGPDGAYGAGLINGWTARGDRPVFHVASGISTGAIIALFTFLGPDYDDEMTEVYTTYETDDLLTPTLFSGLTGGSAVSDTRKYRRLIEDYVDDEVIARLASAAQEGRILLVGTTNLDAARPVTWNLTRIAATGHPDARELIIDVIQASSAIPAAFPPVLVPVEDSEGRRFDEMHVDGGATQQVTLYSPSIPIKRIEDEIGLSAERDLYVVMNNKLKKPYAPVRPRLLSIAGASASSLLGGSGTSDIYKLFAIAQRDDIDMNVLWIPKDFNEEPEEVFDPVYMKALYDLGYEHGVAGDRWSPYPPDFAP